jgi:hypothetical protein
MRTCKDSINNIISTKLENKRISNYKSSRLKGSMTVEAAMVFPIVIIILIGIISYGVYIHDKVCLQTIANRTVQKYSMKNIKEKQIENDVDKLINKLLITNKGNSKVEVNINNKIVYSTLHIKISKNYNHILSLSNLLSFNKAKKKTNIVVASKTKIKNSTKTLKNIDFINDISDNIIIANKYKSNYDRLLNKIAETIKN